MCSRCVETKILDDDDGIFVVGICQGFWVKHTVGFRIALRFDETIPWIIELLPEGRYVGDGLVARAKEFAKVLDEEGCHEFDDFKRVVRTAILWGAVMYVPEDAVSDFGKEDKKPSEVLYNTCWVKMEPSDWDPTKLS